MTNFSHLSKEENIYFRINIKIKQTFKTVCQIIIRKGRNVQFFQNHNETVWNNYRESNLQKCQMQVLFVFMFLNYQL